MIVFKHSGNFNKTENFLKRISNHRYTNLLNKYGQEGVDALASATPIDSGATASSWRYELVEEKDSISIIWSNSNTSDGIPVAILLQYGHATRDGGFVQGQDFINPAIQPIFDRIANDVWKEVTK